MNTLVRHGGSKRDSEQFDEDRLRRSLSEACYSVGMSEGATDDIAARVIARVRSWLDNKPEVTNNDIRRKASETLEMMCPEAGYLYKNQNTIL